MKLTPFIRLFLGLKKRKQDKIIKILQELSSEKPVNFMKHIKKNDLYQSIEKRGNEEYSVSIVGKDEMFGTGETIQQAQRSLAAQIKLKLNLNDKSWKWNGK